MSNRSFLQTQIDEYCNFSLNILFSADCFFVADVFFLEMRLSESISVSPFWLPEHIGHGNAADRDSLGRGGFNKSERNMCEIRCSTDLSAPQSLSECQSTSACLHKNPSISPHIVRNTLCCVSPRRQISVLIPQKNRMSCHYQTNANSHFSGCYCLAGE